MSTRHLFCALGFEIKCGWWWWSKKKITKRERGTVGQRVRGVNGCKGLGDGPVAAGSVGCVGLGQSARLKGTWVGLLWL